MKLGPAAHRNARRRRQAARAWESLEARCLLAAGDPVINEFLADNQGNQTTPTPSIKDDYGKYADWIEVYNPGDTAANLANWHLTDSKNNPNKWTFPANTLLAPKAYLIVYASDRSTTFRPPDPAQPGVTFSKMHANFSLDQGGEYLALVKPDGVTKTTEFDPYPAQLGDVSYGFGPGINAPSAPVLVPFAPSRTFVPLDASLGSAWQQRAFDDSGWISGNTGIGFEVQPQVNLFRTHMVDTSSGSIDNIGQATGLLDGNLAGYTVAFDG